MPRLVLLGFEDDDVDVLSRVSGLKPRPEVLVAHPDPEALILHLAEISELETETTAPEPRKDDVVVVPETPSEFLAGWVEPFRKLGIPIVPPTALDTGMDGLLAGTANAAAEPKANAVTTSEEPEGLPASGTVPEVPATEPAPETPETPKADGRHLAAEVFSRPEATFGYLIRETLGEDATATLWWEGLENLWVPLVWAGDSPWSSTSRVDLASPWGRFGVTELGPERRNQDLLDALTRVAEDVALRNQARWDRQKEEISALGLPRGDAETSIWVSRVLEVLEPEAAWLWSRKGDDWSSIRTWGDGITLEGRLTLSHDLLENLFREKRWERWSPSEDMRMQMVFSDRDHQWKLRLERVKQALERKPS